VFLSTRILPFRPSPSGAMAADRKTVLAGGIMWLVVSWLQSGADNAPDMAGRMARIAADFAD